MRLGHYFEFHSVQDIGAGVTDGAGAMIARRGSLLFDAFQHFGRDGLTGEDGLAAKKPGAAGDYRIVAFAAFRLGKYHAQMAVHGAMIAKERWKVV